MSDQKFCGSYYHTSSIPRGMFLNFNITDVILDGILALSPTFLFQCTWIKEV